ncbi:proton channel OtopLc-like isoform X2 [Symsagittifera roscoffensis]|uniref:proton channel OtopLc-like isoform X2 n=1 Tax=Symsagittifera roscoffensis TaxID=84072 RepID=UPI00307B6447
MSSIFGKDRQFMSDLELEVASFVDLPLRPGDNSPDSHRRYAGDLEIPNNLPINRIGEKPRSPNPQSSHHSHMHSAPADHFQDNLKHLIDITPQHSRPGSYVTKPVSSMQQNGPNAIPYSTPQVPIPSVQPMHFDDTDGGQLFDNLEDALGPIRDTNKLPDPLQPDFPPINPMIHQKHSTSVKSLKTIGRELESASNFANAPFTGAGGSGGVGYGGGFHSETLPIKHSSHHYQPKLFAPTAQQQNTMMEITETVPLKNFRRDRGGGGENEVIDEDDEDDRHTHISMATSVVSTIPLSTDPSATKTISALYAMLTIIAGAVIATRGVMSDVILHEEYNDMFAGYMFAMGSLACLYLCASASYSRRQSNAPVDHHNGSIYICVGLFVFCIGSLTHSGMVVAETFQYSEEGACMVNIRLIHLGLRVLFQVAQLFVLLLHSKVCIQGCVGLARFFIAHIIATDFFLWFILSVKETQESIVANIPRHFHNIRLACERNFANSFTDLEEESTPILFPMAVAYCVVAGCIMGIMWENVGKNYAIEHREESQEEHDKQLEFKCKDGVMGVMWGSLAVASSVCVLVLYVFFSTDIHITQYVISVYQGFNGVWLGIMILLLPIALCTLKRHRKQDHYHNTLNKPILIVTTCGAFAYCVLNIMAALLELLTSRSYSSIACVGSYSLQAVETAFQTVYLLDGLRRCPRRKRKKPSKSFVIFFLLVNITLWITIIFELKESSLNPFPEEFYGILNWQIILHFIGPIASLYRFHSVCCLIDVWKFAY